MDIQESYRILNVSRTASNEEVTAAYKKLAFRFHPDKNPGRLAWANEAMTRLNLAYAAIMSHRFKEQSEEVSRDEDEEAIRPAPPPRTRGDDRAAAESEILTKRFIALRESAKDALYRYFQYNLFNHILRETVSNRAVFNKIVHSLRVAYHAIRRLMTMTNDPELLDHFSVFTDMIFNFYRASECITIIDSYESLYDVEAWRGYRRGDELLHQGHKEIFYDRHNRGYFKQAMAAECVRQAEKIFRANLAVFPDSSWSVETRIKHEYTLSLLNYLNLFFSE